MTKFIEGIFRELTGFQKTRLGKRNVKGLGASGEIDEEMWTIIDFYSENKDTGLEFLKKSGIKDPNSYK